MPSLVTAPARPGRAICLACQLASRRKDHGQLSIITNVLIDDSELHNVLDTVIVNCRKQTAFHLFLDAASHRPPQPDPG